MALSWFVCALSLIPFLGVKRQSAQAASGGGDASAPHYFNGFATASVAIAGLSVVEYYLKYPIYTLLYKNYQQFCFVSFICALLLSILLFIRSKYVPVTAWNPYAKSGRLIGDLFIGREINPRFFNRIDVKLTHRRVALIATLIINVIFLTRNIKFAAAPAAVEAPLTSIEIALQFIQSIRLDPVAAAVSILIILNVLDALIFEHHLVGTFELQNEGVGAQLLLQYAAYPIWSSLFAKFALQHKISDVPNWLLGLLCALYVSGLLFKRLASELKYHYQVYPNSARSASKHSVD